MPVNKATIQQFAETIKAKYPEYKDIDDTLLTHTIVEKYPEYKDMVQLEMPKQEQPKISAKDAMAKYGITNQMPAKESTVTVQPQETLKGDIAKETGKEREQQRKKDTPLAIKNTADLYFKNNGIKPTKSQREQKINELTGQHENDNLVLGYDSQGNPRMERKLGGFAGFWQGASEGFLKEGEARKFIDLTKDDRIKKMNEELASDKEYLPANTEYTTLGGFGRSLGEGAPMMGKAAVGATAGAGLAALAPETGGVSLAGLAPTMAFLFSAPSAANVAYMEEFKRRFKEGKSNGLSDSESYDKAQNQALISESTSLAQNAFLSRIPISEASGEGVVNGLKQFVKTGAKTSGEFAGISAGSTLLNELSAKAKGYNKEQSIGDIAMQAGQSGKDAFIMGTALHFLTHPEILATLPKYLQAQYKGYLSKTSPEELGQSFHEMQEKGLVTQEGIESAQKELNSYNQANKKVPKNLPHDKEAAITGLIEKKTNLENGKTELDKAFHDDENKKIESIDNRIKLAANTDKDVTSIELDDITGQSTGNHKAFDDLSKKEQLGYAEKAKEEHGEADVKEIGEGENKKYVPKAKYIDPQGIIEVLQPIKIEDTKEYSDKDKAQQAAELALAKHYYENRLEDNLKPQRNERVNTIPEEKIQEETEKPVIQTNEGGNAVNESKSTTEGGNYEAEVNKNTFATTEKEINERAENVPNEVGSDSGTNIGVRKLVHDEAALPQSEAQQIQELRRQRDNHIRELEEQLRAISKRYGGKADPKAFNREDRQRWELLQRELQVGIADRAASEQKGNGEGNVQGGTNINSSVSRNDRGEVLRNKGQGENGDDGGGSNIISEPSREQSTQTQAPKQTLLEDNNIVGEKNVPKYSEQEVGDFAKKTKFKVSQSNDYSYFTINENNQIRIYRAGGKHNRSYRVTLHHIDPETGVFGSKTYSKNEHADNLQEAKSVAAKIYFNEIRKDVSDKVDISDRQIDLSKVPTEELQKRQEKTNDFSEMAAIKRELDSRKNESKKEQSKDNIVEQPSSEIPTVREKQTEAEAEQTTEPPMTGITHAQMDETARELGLSEYEQKPEKIAEWDAEADARLRNDPKTIPNLISKLEKGIEPDHIDQRVMIRHIASLKSRIRENPTPELLAEYKKAADLSNIVGGQKVAKSLVARKAIVSVEDSLAEFLVEKQNAGDHPLSEAEIKEQTAKFDELEKAKNEYKASLDKALEENAKLKAQAEYNKTHKSTKPKGEKKSHEEYVKERQDIVSNIKNKWSKAGKDILSSDIPYRKQLAAIAPDILKLVENIGSEFGGKLEEIVSKVYEDVKDLVSKKDIYDIIAGEHTEKKEKLTRNQLAEDLRNAKKEASLLSQLRKERLGEAKIKTPSEKNKKTARIQELENKIKEVRSRRKQKELEDEGVHEAAVETNAERLARKQKSLLNQIDKIQNDLKSGNFLKEPPKERRIILDKKTQLLQDRYADLQAKRHREIERDRYNKMSRSRKIWDKVWQVLGLKRVIQTAIDFSIPFRQNITTTINPLKWIPKVEDGKLKMGIAPRQFVNMFHYTFSPKAFRRMMFTLKETGLYHRMMEDGITLSEPGELKLDKREEEFRTSIMTQIRNNEKLGYARYLAEPVTASERAAAAALNTVRVEMYNEKVKALESHGVSREHEPELYKDAAKWVMNMTGRGNMLKMIEDSHSGRVLANNTFYGARLMASRFNLLNPYYYARMPKELRVEVFKDMSGYTAGLILTGLALKAAGGSVSLDPDDSDFMQARFGDTRYDLTGGMVSYVKTFLRLAKLAYKRTNLLIRNDETKTETTQANKYGEFTGRSSLSFFTNKFAPNTAYAYHFLSNVGGDYQPFEPTEVLNAAPMYFDDIKAAVERNGVSSFATIGLPSLFGVGVQTYSNKAGELTNEDYKQPEWKFLKDKGVEFHTPNKNAYDIPIDTRHQDGKMTDEDFDKFIAIRNSKVKEGIAKLIKHGLPVVKGVSVEVVQAKDITTEQLKEELKNISRKASEEAKAKLFPKSENVMEKIKKEIGQSQLEIYKATHQ